MFSGGVQITLYCGGVHLDSGGTQVEDSGTYCTRDINDLSKSVKLRSIGEVPACKSQEQQKKTESTKF